MRQAGAADIVSSISARSYLPFLAFMGIFLRRFARLVRPALGW
jgi:hypothetical protein